MIIHHFGFFDRTYSRNAILRESLIASGVEVVETVEKEMTIGGILKMFSASCKDAGATLVGYSDNRFGVLLAKLSFRRPVVWDAFYSLYDTRVNDRKLISKYNPKAFWYWLLDWLNIFLADGYIFDTEEHAKFFQETFGAKKEKSLRLFLGSEAEPINCEEEDVVGFYGKYIPLQGIEKIIRAAELLPEYSFELIGSGQTFPKIKKLAKDLRLSNVSFIERLPYEELLQRICSWSVSLGIFGDSQKAGRVIPNKVYDAAALGKAIVTLDTPAIRELFTDGENVLLTSSDPTNIAENIKVLMEDSQGRKRLGGSASSVVSNYASKNVLGKKLRDFCAKVADKAL